MRPRGTTGALALLPVVAGLGLSTCGTAHTTSTALPGVHVTRPQPGHPGHARRLPPPTPSLGVAQRVLAPGTTLVVSVLSVIDPLRDSGAKILPGMKPVGVLVAVRNAGPGGYDSSATGDFSLLSASGPATPVFIPTGTCQTPLQDFMNAISAGELRTGCVAFAIPSKQAPSRVRFSPDGGATGHSRSWAVSPVPK